MNTTQWYRQFLTLRNLNSPSGIPLYQYKVKDHEFVSLVEILKRSPTSLSFWDACFVLYATEWWRREYSGGHWSWDPILSAIGKRGLNVQERNSIVETGFNHWDRSIYTNKQGRDFIGTVVIESGIPLGVLREGHYLSELISESYRELGSISSTQYEYLDLIRPIARKLRIPDSLNKDAFLYLILDFVRKLVDLNDQFDLAKSDTPVEDLDVRYPDWRDEFPLRIENDTAKKFLDSLLSDSAKIEMPKGYAISTFYELMEKNGKWMCQSYLSIKSGLHKYSDLGIQESEYNQLSSKSEIYMEDIDGARRIGFAFKRSQDDAVRIDGLDEYPVHGDIESQSWSLFLSDPGSSRRIELATPNGNALSFNEPLIFSRKDSRWLLIATGSVRLPDNLYRIVIGSNARLAGEGIIELGSFSDQKKIVEIRSDCDISDNENLFRIKFSNQNQSFRYEFRPDSNYSSINYCKRENKDIYLGFPRIYQLRNDGNLASRITTGIEFNIGNGWQKARNDVFGRLRIRLIRNGETMFCRTISVLPSDFKIEFRNVEGNSSLKKVVLFNTANFVLHVKANVNSKIYTDEQGNGHIEVGGSDIHDAPEFFRVGLQNPLLSDAVLITIPYPENEVQFYDRNHQKLRNRSNLFIHKLHGVRLNIANLNSQAENHLIEIRLVDQYLNENISLRKGIKVNEYSNESIPLISFEQQLTRLFSITENIDARLEISCQQQAVEIRQFVSKPFITEEGQLSIKTDEVEPNSIKVKGFRLDKEFVESEIIDLEYIDSSNHWSLPEVAGVWLLYPDVTSSQLFRPYAYRSIPEGDQSEQVCELSELHQVALTSKFEERMVQLTGILDKMADDLGHPDWARLEKLYELTNHLPMATMDVWKALAKHPKAIITSAMKLSENLIKSLTDEFSIIWHQYSVTSWIEVFGNYDRFVRSKYPQHYELLVNAVLDRLENHLELVSVKWIIEKEVLKNTTYEQDLSGNLDVVGFVVRLRLNGEEGKPGLRGRHTHDQWPDQLNKITGPLFKKLPSELRHIIPQGLPYYQQSVIYLPFILAISSTSSDQIKLPELSPTEMLRIMEIIEFDADWFKAIYDIIKGYTWLKFTSNSRNYE